MVIVVKMAPWYKHFTCVHIHGNVLLCAMCAVSMVTTVVVAVALKMKSILKEVNTTVGGSPPSHYADADRKHFRRM